MAQGTLGKRAQPTKCFLFTVNLEGGPDCSFFGGHL